MTWITTKKCSAASAADMIRNGDVLGVSGFTLAGYPKAVPLAIAARAEKLHEAGQEFKVTLFAGASTGDSCDGALARAKALKLRMPYQSNPSLRKAINATLTRIWARWVILCVLGLSLRRRLRLLKFLRFCRMDAFAFRLRAVTPSAT